MCIPQGRWLEENHYKDAVLIDESVINMKRKCMEYHRVGLSACVCPGQGAGMMGDAVLVDVGKRFYAVADSPDRSPSSAITLLTMIARSLENQNVTDDGEDMTAVLNRSRVLVEKTFELIEPGNVCTFTGIQLTGSGHQTGCVFMHTGDSMMYHFNRGEGRVQNITVKNFWLAGRVKQLYQCGSIMLEPGDLLMLVTDGFEEIYSSAEARSYIETAFCRERDVKRIMQNILQRDNNGIELWDDIGIVLLDPFIPRDTGFVILGEGNDNINVIRGDN